MIGFPQHLLTGVPDHFAKGVVEHDPAMFLVLDENRVDYAIENAFKKLRGLHEFSLGMFLVGDILHKSNAKLRVCLMVFNHHGIKAHLDWRSIFAEIDLVDGKIVSFLGELQENFSVFWAVIRMSQIEKGHPPEFFMSIPQHVRIGQICSNNFAILIHRAYADGRLVNDGL